MFTNITRSLVLWVCFVDRCLSFCPYFFWPLCCMFFCLLVIVLSVLLSFGHCVFCSSIYGLWLPLLFLQTLFTDDRQHSVGFFKMFNNELIYIKISRHDISKILLDMTVNNINHSIHKTNYYMKEIEWYQ
jgi:hypothetical protein